MRIAQNLTRRPPPLLRRALLLAVLACREDAPSPTPPGADALVPAEGSISLTHVCGNKWVIRNSNSFAVEVTWRVRDTGEEGVRVLPEPLAEDLGVSETELVTAGGSVLELYVDERWLRTSRRPEQLCAAAPAHSAPAGSSIEAGEWSAPFPMPIVAVHLHLLPNGKVLFWGKQPPQLWNRSTNTFTPLTQPHLVFCAGHAFLPNGKLLVAGGHIENNMGLPDAALFSYSTASWSVAPAMPRGRWYPTLTTLGNGQVVAIAGPDQTGTPVRVPDLWTGSKWRPLTGASLQLPAYPRTFLAPDGRVFYAGQRQRTYYLSTSGGGSWTFVADRLYGVRDNGAAVMYEPGKILVAGGGRTTNTAEVIDLNRPSPRWQWTGSMAHARRNLNATVLPDGTVLVTGGTGGTDSNDETQAVHAAELWDPATDTWTVLASNSVVRAYHSTALLLPDARVLVAGGGEAGGRNRPPAIDHKDGELFSPPYLFKGARPRISSAPGITHYGQSFTVSTPNASSIAKVAWVRLGSVTHAFDQNQRFVPLTFSATSTGIVVTPPANRNVAPPGHYMLFLLNGRGVPSVAKIQRVGP